MPFSLSEPLPDQSLEIEPIDLPGQQRVTEITYQWIDRAGQLFSRPFKRIPILFDLGGRSAGMFKVLGNRGWIRYNPWIFSKYFEDNIRDTVPHEVGHYVVHELYGMRNIKPHGSQWRGVMEAFGANAGVTTDFDLSGLPQRRQRTHSYSCACTDHQLSTTRHNRMRRRRAIYHCLQCSEPLVYCEDC